MELLFEKSRAGCLRTVLEKERESLERKDAALFKLRDEENAEQWQREMEEYRLAKLVAAREAKIAGNGTLPRFVSQPSRDYNLTLKREIDARARELERHQLMVFGTA